MALWERGRLERVVGRGGPELAFFLSIFFFSRMYKLITFEPKMRSFKHSSLNNIGASGRASSLASTTIYITSFENPDRFVS